MVYRAECSMESNIKSLSVPMKIAIVTFAFSIAVDNKGGNPKTALDNP